NTTTCAVCDPLLLNTTTCAVCSPLLLNTTTDSHTHTHKQHRHKQHRHTHARAHTHTHTPSLKPLSRSHKCKLMLFGVRKQACWPGSVNKTGPHVQTYTHTHTHTQHFNTCGLWKQ